jgi:hypothetical protein
MSIYALAGIFSNLDHLKKVHEIPAEEDALKSFSLAPTRGVGECCYVGGNVITKARMRILAFTMAYPEKLAPYTHFLDFIFLKAILYPNTAAISLNFFSVIFELPPVRIL